MAIKFLNNVETSTGSLTITKATTDPLLYLYNTTNGSGATIRFSDQTTPSQIGDITFYHSDGSSQGGGASFHFASQPDTVLVVGSSTVNGRFVSKSAGSLGEVDYGFYDDTNTGMVRTSADNISLVAGGVRGIAIGTTAVSIRHAGSTKLQTTSGGVDITGDVNTSGNANINGGNITINGSFPRFNIYSNDAGEDDWSIINNNGIFGIYNNTAADYALSISETVNTVIINSGNIQLNGTGRITGVDTVSAGTDAANKTYVDTAVSGVPIGDYLPLAAGSGSPLTGDLYITKNSPVLTITDTVASDLKLEIKQSGSTSNFISRGGTSSKGQFNFRITDGSTVTNALFINQQANVGIGTTSPTSYGSTARTLEVRGASGTGTGLVRVSTADNSVGGALYAGSGGVVLNAQTNNSLSFATNNGEKMRIDSAGNVGIGATSPLRKLHVVGNFAVNAGTGEYYGVNIAGGEGADPVITIGDWHNSSANIKWDSAGNYLRIDAQHTTSGAPIVFSGNDSAIEYMRIDSGGNVGIGTTSPIRKLDVAGITRTVGFQNTDNHIEGLLYAGFANGVANQNYDIQLGNISFWGYIEVEITGTYSNQNTAGKLTKIYAVGVNPAVGSNAGIIYTNDTRVSDSIGTIKDNISLGDLRFDGTDDTGVFAIRVSHIVSTGNGYTIKVRAFTHNSNGNNGAAGILTNLTLSPVYTQASLSRQYVHYNQNVGIGTTSPSSRLHIHQAGSGTNNSIITEDDARKIFIGRDSIKATTLSDTPAELYIQQDGGNATFGNDIRLGGNLTLTTNGRYLRAEDNAGTTTRLLGINGSNTTYIGPIDAYAGGGIYYGASANVSSHTLYTGASARLHINSSGNVGIGTTSPTSKIHVIGQDATFYSNTGTQSMQVGRNVTERLELYVNDQLAKITAIQDSDNNGTHDFILNRVFAGTGANNFRIQKDGSTQLIVDTTGNVGIGTTSPSYKLQVGNAGALADSIRIGSYDAVKNTRQYIGYARQDSGLFETSTSGNTPSSVLPGVSGIRIVNTEGSILSTKADQSIQLLTHIYNGSSRVTLHANYDGNVGIGTTSPNGKLTVADGETSGVSKTALEFIPQDTYNRNIIFSYDRAQGAYRDLDIDANDVHFNNGGTEKVRITSSGKVGIGTTAPSQLLHVAGNMRLQNQLYDSTNSLGSNGEVLTKVSAGTEWKVPAVNAQMPNNTAPASAANVGTIRYRSTSNTSFVDMSMQTGATTYTWVNIVSNFW